MFGSDNVCFQIPVGSKLCVISGAVKDVVVMIDAAQF